MGKIIRNGVEYKQGVGFTDFATAQKGGVVKVNGYGLNINGNGTLTTQKASNTQVDEETDYFMPLTPSHISRIMSNYGIESKEDVSTLKSQVNENKFTLGYSGKNLLNGIGQSETITNYKRIDSSNIEAGEYILSGKAIRSEGVSESLCTIRFGLPTGEYIQFQFKCDNEKFSKNINLQKKYGHIIVFAGASAADSDGITTIYTDLMLRPASITDDTYEPYKPSIDERLKALEAAILNS